MVVLFTLKRLARSVFVAAERSFPSLLSRASIRRRNFRRRVKSGFPAFMMRSVGIVK